LKTTDSVGEQRFVTLGVDAVGRVLVIVHTQREEQTRLISARKASRGETEKYHAWRIRFQPRQARRGAVIASPGKTRITIMLDDDVIEHFRAQAELAGVGYQTFINALLRKAAFDVSKPKAKSAKPEAKPLTVAMLRRVLREELGAHWGSGVQRRF
jgi:uncharacterized protein (DUF4415 family)